MGLGHQSLTVAELREHLKDLPDDARVQVDTMGNRADVFPIVRVVAERWSGEERVCVLQAGTDES